MHSVAFVYDDDEGDNSESVMLNTDELEAMTSALTDMPVKPTRNVKPQPPLRSASPPPAGRSPPRTPPRTSPRESPTIPRKSDVSRSPRNNQSLERSSAPSKHSKSPTTAKTLTKKASPRNSPIVPRKRFAQMRTDKKEKPAELSRKLSQVCCFFAFFLLVSFFCFVEIEWCSSQV